MMDIYMCGHISLITTRSKKCVKLLFQKILPRYKTCRMREKAFDYSFPLALRYVPDWFVTPKMLKDLENKLFTYNKYNRYINSYIMYSRYKQSKACKKEIDRVNGYTMSSIKMVKSVYT